MSGGYRYFPDHGRLVVLKAQIRDTLKSGRLWISLKPEDAAFLLDSMDEPPENPDARLEAAVAAVSAIGRRQQKFVPTGACVIFPPRPEDPEEARKYDEWREWEGALSELDYAYMIWKHR